MAPHIRAMVMVSAFRSMPQTVWLVRFLMLLAMDPPMRPRPTMPAHLGPPWLTRAFLTVPMAYSMVSWQTTSRMARMRRMVSSN